MPRPCSICGHRERAAIEQELFRNAVPFRNVAERFKVSATSLHRHKQHVPVEVQKALKGEKVTEDAIAGLPLRKQRYLKGLVAGKSKRQAALDAGFSEAMAAHASSKIETKDVRAAFARLIREAVPPEAIAETLKAGLEATQTRFFAGEDAIEQRVVVDYGERRQYAALAAELGGLVTPGAKEERGGGVIIILPDPEPELQNRTIEASPADKPGPILILPEPEEGG